MLFRSWVEVLNPTDSLIKLISYQPLGTDTTTGEDTAFTLRAYFLKMRAEVLVGNPFDPVQTPVSFRIKKIYIPLSLRAYRYLLSASIPVNDSTISRQNFILYSNNPQLLLEHYSLNGDGIYTQPPALFSLDSLSNIGGVLPISGDCKTFQVYTSFLLPESGEVELVYREQTVIRHQITSFLPGAGEISLSIQEINGSSFVFELSDSILNLSDLYFLGSLTVLP